MTSLNKQRGAALILVLMVVAIITSVGFFSSSNLLSFSKFTNDLANRQQAQWYAIGVESTASNFLEQRLKEKKRSVVIADYDLPVIKVSLGTTNIEGTLRDLNSCLNVNSLIKKTPTVDRYTINQGGIDQYKDLLKVLNFSNFEMEGLVYSLVDWMDSDIFYSNTYGAEDDHYVRKDYPYRTANQPISILDEIYSIKNYSKEIMEILSPYLCALPEVGSTAININAISKDKPALLVMLFGENLSITSAKNILHSRPEGGFLDTKEFLSHPELEGIVVSKITKSQLKVSSRFYLLETKVYTNDYPYHLQSLLNLDDNGSIQILSRRLGVF